MIKKALAETWYLLRSLKKAACLLLTFLEQEGAAAAAARVPGHLPAPVPPPPAQFAATCRWVM